MTKADYIRALSMHRHREGGYTAGETLQLVVPAGAWKCSELHPGGTYGLLSESVMPGFEYEDSQIASRRELLVLFPHARDLAATFCRG